MWYVFVLLTEGWDAQIPCSLENGSRGRNGLTFAFVSRPKEEPGSWFFYTSRHLPMLVLLPGVPSPSQWAIPQGPVVTELLFGGVSSAGPLEV